VPRRRSHRLCGRVADRLGSRICRLRLLLLELLSSRFDRRRSRLGWNRCRCDEFVSANQLSQSLNHAFLLRAPISLKQAFDLARYRGSDAS